MSHFDITTRLRHPVHDPQPHVHHITGDIKDNAGVNQLGDYKNQKCRRARLRNFFCKKCYRPHLKQFSELRQ